MFTPSDRAFDAIHRVAKATGRPASSVVTEQVEVLVEHMENLASVLEHAHQLRQEEPQAIAAAARSAYSEVLPSLLRNMGTNEDWKSHSDLAWLADQLGLFETETPPPSNTGATSPRREAAEGTESA